MYFLLLNLKKVIRSRVTTTPTPEPGNGFDVVEDDVDADDDDGWELYILESDLMQLTHTQQHLLSYAVSIICLASVVANVSSLVVNWRRRLRPFFRACLISLACSDLTSSIFTTITYISHFCANYLQTWTLGSLMCSLEPYVTTVAILSCSMALMAIALDRHFALLKSAIGCWQPSCTFCVLCISGIWAMAAVASTPMLYIYSEHMVYVWTDDMDADDPDFDEAIVNVDLLPMCVSTNRNVVLYYVILFVLIFVPCILGFLWLNASIAWKLWQRRHHAAAATATVKPASTSQTSTTTTTLGRPARQLKSAASNRKAHHVRLFSVIILMMAVFLVCRLPNWLFMIMRMYGSYADALHWILHYSFGISNLISCALNPLFYTFLAETLLCASKVKRALGRCCCSCCCWQRNREAGTVDMPAETDALADNCTLCCMLHAKLRCHYEQALQKKTQPPTSDGDANGSGFYDAAKEQSSLNDVEDYSERQIFAIYTPTGDAMSITTITTMTKKQQQ